MIVDEKKEVETGSEAVGPDIIISEPEGGKGNKYHKAKDGKFASPGKGEAASSESEVAPEVAEKPSLSAIISKHCECRRKPLRRVARLGKARVSYEVG